MSSVEAKPESISLLSEEQEKFLADCETDFKSRYTENDSEFMAVKEDTSNTPPLVHPWYNKPRRNFDWGDRRGRDGGNNSGGGYRQHRQNQGNYQQNQGNYQQNQGNYQQHRQGDRFNQQRFRPY